ncbi:hypothetical protein AK86_03245 [Streptococcus pneumoniae B1599]|nr:hypothetical protein AK86_03245 [Streptococcus pneumoniae B1599]
MDAKVYSLEANSKRQDKSDGGRRPLTISAGDYVQTVANTADLPRTGGQSRMERWQQTTSATVGKATYTVVTSFGNDADVPAELRGQDVETASRSNGSLNQTQ